MIPDDELARAVYKLRLRAPWELAGYFRRKYKQSF